MVYTVHETVAHLVIFVSGSVARKEHSEFTSNIDLIDVLPPGLYEATFERKSPDIANAELIGGDWVMRCEQRTLDDIRAMGGNSPEDERRFATAARVSEINLALYRTFLQPVVKSFVPEDAGRALREWHPIRIQYVMWVDGNPYMQQMGAKAIAVSQYRAPAASDNAFTAVQKNASQQIVDTLAAWGDAHDRFSEALFLAVYGSPLLQAAVGVDSKSTKPLRKAQKSVLHREFVEARLAELKSRIAQGGLTESVLRGLLYVGLSRGRVDERGAEALRRIRLTDEDKRLTLQQFKAIAREQFFLVLLYREETLAAIPDLLPEEDGRGRRAFDALLKILTASGELAGEAASRLRKVEQLFKTKGQTGSSNIDAVSLARAS